MITFLLQSSACAVIFYLVYALFFKDHPNHRFNRFYLLSTIILSVAIPWIEITIGVETVVLAARASNPSTIVPIATTSMFTISNMITAVYLIGIIISLTIFTIKLAKLLHLIRKGEKSKVDGYKTVMINEDLGICSFLNHIIIPKSQENNINQFEISHEKSHLKQLHSIDIMLVWVFQSFFWFNPIVYLYRRRLMEVHEFLADEEAIKEVGRSNYQDYILTVVSQKLRPQLVNNFKSIIKTRLVMMNSKSKPSRWSYLALFAVFSLSIFLFSCQTKKITKISTNEEPPSQWLTETIIDTLVIIDYDTYEESVSYAKTDLQYRLDTTVILDADTFAETVSVKKTYNEKSKKFLEERSQFYKGNN